MNLSVKRFNETYITIVDENGSEISLVWSRHINDEAIAKMFAAAPELLNACLMMVSDSFSMLEAMEATHSAIAKAKGE